MLEIPLSYPESHDGQVKIANDLRKVDEKVEGILSKNKNFEERLNNFAELEYTRSIDKDLQALKSLIVVKLKIILLRLDVVGNDPELIKTLKSSISNTIASIKDNQNVNDYVEEVDEV